MAAPRPVDIAINRFYLATAAVLGGFLLPVHLFVWAQAGAGPNVAFIASCIIMLAFTVLGIEYTRRRDPANVGTWGESMVGSVYIFFAGFWAYGVVPHHWLLWADNELQWRADKLLVGPSLGFTDGEGILEWILPFEIPYTVLRDIIAVTIYIILFVEFMAVWHIWQIRDRKPAVAIETSQFGRPLLKEGANA